MRRDDTTLAGLNFHLALSPCVPLVRVDLARCVRGALGGQPIPRLPLDGGDDSGCCSEGEVGCSCGPDPLGGLAASGESVGSGVAPAQAHWAGPFDQMPVHAVPAQMHYGSGRAAKPLPAAGGVPGASPIAPCTYEVQPEGTLAPDQPWVPTPDGVEPPRVDPCVVDCGSEPPPMPGHDVVMGEDCEWEQVPSDDGAPPHPYGPLQPSGPSGASGPVQSSGGSAGGRPAAGAAYDVVAKNDPTDARARLYLGHAVAGMTMYYDEDMERKEDRLNQILRIPITDFELSVRARNCLNKMNIMTLGDLVRKTEQELLSYKNFGETSLNEIKEILGSKGLRLGMAREEAVLSIEAPQKRYTTGENVEAMNRPISDLELSIRARRTVEALGCLTVGDIIQHSEDELLGMPNFGVTSLMELRNKLSEYTLKLKSSKDS